MNHNHDSVASAFDVLLREIDSAIGGINQQGAEAFQKGDYDNARHLSEKASQVTIIRKSLHGLHDEWEHLFTPPMIQTREHSAQQHPKKEKKRLKRGLQTQRDAYFAPILQGLVEIGGRGKPADVLDRVKERMKPIFSQYDLQHIPSGGARWHKNANFARLKMVEEGWLSSGSPQGVWEITEAGRRWLTNRAI